MKISNYVKNLTTCVKTCLAESPAEHHYILEQTRGLRLREHGLRRREVTKSGGMKGWGVRDFTDEKGAIFCVFLVL